MQDASNDRWIKAQEARSQQNSINAELRRRAFPELSANTLQSIAIAEAQKRIESRQVARMCSTLLNEIVDMAIGTECDMEEQCEHHNRSSKLHYTSMTWKQRAIAVFYYLHPALANGDAEVTCSVFGLNHSRFSNWIKARSYFCKWIPFVEGMTVSDVMAELPRDLRERFRCIDPQSTVVIAPKFRITGQKRLISAMSDPNMSRQKASKLASTSNQLHYFRSNVRSVGSGRTIKYPSENGLLLTKVKNGWESGNPLSRHEIYLWLIKVFGNIDAFGPPTQFCYMMRLNTGSISPALAQWVRRQLTGASWSVRKESVSQTVPRNWIGNALDASSKIRDAMKVCDVVINADEVFIKYYPRETEFIVPRGTRRVGSNLASDSKKGCTVMVACEMHSSQLLPPFIVMTGTHNGTLARRFASWRDNGGDASVHFQPSHWMDIPTAKKFIDFLLRLYPNRKIGLIWDAASSHICEAIVSYGVEKKIVSALIPG